MADGPDKMGLQSVGVNSSAKAPGTDRKAGTATIAEKSDNDWLQIRLVGTMSNRDAVGTQVTVVTNLGSFVQEVHRGRGYQSHYGHCLHFGLGKASVVESVEVRWHGGNAELFRNMPLDQKSTLIQGTETKGK